MSQKVTSIRVSDEKCETNGGVVYFVTWNNGTTIRMELSPDMAEHLSWHHGVAITAR
jgi:hypothetical protein